MVDVSRYYTFKTTGLLVIHVGISLIGFLDYSTLKPFLGHGVPLDMELFATFATNHI